jgi:hypothetical protein
LNPIKIHQLPIELDSICSYHLVSQAVVRGEENSHENNAKKRKERKKLKLLKHYQK